MIFKDFSCNFCNLNNWNVKQSFSNEKGNWVRIKCLSCNRTKKISKNEYIKLKKHSIKSFSKVSKYKIYYEMLKNTKCICNSNNFTIRKGKLTNTNSLCVICKKCKKSVGIPILEIENNNVDFINLFIKPKSWVITKKPRKNFFWNTNNEIYDELLNSSYKKCCSLLRKKYGYTIESYFCNKTLRSINSRIKRTAEGLIIHHIKEDQAIMLSTREYAKKWPFCFQKGDQLVYCNLLEHLVLHIKIWEDTKNIPTKQNEILGLGGAINFIIPMLNDLYSGFISKREYINKQKELIINNYDWYLQIMKYFINVINLFRNKKWLNYDSFSQIIIQCKRSFNEQNTIRKNVFKNLEKNEKNLLNQNFKNQILKIQNEYLQKIKYILIDLEKIGFIE